MLYNTFTIAHSYERIREYMKYASAIDNIQRFLDRNSIPLAPHDIAWANRLRIGAIRGPSFFPMLTSAFANFPVA